MSSTPTRLNLTQLATLRELARRGTLSAAAEHLGYTPGAVSQHLSLLERTVGVPLTERSGRILLLTEAGLRLAEHAEKLLEAEADAIAAVRDLGADASGSLLIGTWGSTAAALLPPLVRRMEERYPDIRLRSREIDVDDAVSAVQHGDVDMAFGLDYSDAPFAREQAVSIVELQRERFSIAAALSEHTAEGRIASIEELAQLPWILPPETSHYGRAFRFGCRRRGFEPRVVHEVTDTAASLQLAAAGSGVTPMTQLMRRLNPTVDLVALEMADPLSRQLILAIRDGADPRQRTRLVAGVVEDVVQQVLGD